MKKLLLTAAAIAGFACASQGSLILSNSFDYPDGPLVTVSTGSPLGVWTTHSGTAGQIDVTSGVITLTVPDSEDVSTVLTNATFPTAISNGTIYASFDINVSVAPSTPVYFGHFRGIGTGDFRGRVFLSSGSSATTVKLGVVNGSSTAAVYVPIEFDLNTTHKVVIKFLDGGLATVWLDPNSEDNTANRAVGTDVASNTYDVCRGVLLELAPKQQHGDFHTRQPFGWDNLYGCCSLGRRSFNLSDSRPDNRGQCHNRTDPIYSW